MGLSDYFVNKKTSSSGERTGDFGKISHTQWTKPGYKTRLRKGLGMSPGRTFRFGKEELNFDEMDKRLWDMASKYKSTSFNTDKLKKELDKAGVSGYRKAKIVKYFKNNYGKVVSTTDEDAEAKRRLANIRASWMSDSMVGRREQINNIRGNVKADQMKFQKRHRLGQVQQEGGEKISHSHLGIQGATGQTSAMSFMTGGNVSAADDFKSAPTFAGLAKKRGPDADKKNSGASPNSIGGANGFNKPGMNPPSGPPQSGSNIRLAA